MKHFPKYFLILISTIFIQCSSEDAVEEATILGRWKIVGFENIQYEFTENKRFSIYSVNNTFPDLQEFLTQNPTVIGLDWYFEGEIVVVDLNFGNLLKLTPSFSCNNKVIKWLNENDEVHSTFYRIDHDISKCN